MLNVNVTGKAADRINVIREDEKVTDEQKLRLSVVGGGCSGFSYKMSFDEKKDGDMVISQHGVDVVVDRRSLLYLMGTEVDFSDGLNGKGFTYNNPNASRTCGCGTSFGV